MSTTRILNFNTANQYSASFLSQVIMLIKWVFVFMGPLYLQEVGIYRDEANILHAEPIYICTPNINSLIPHTYLRRSHHVIQLSIEVG